MNFRLPLLLLCLFTFSGCGDDETTNTTTTDPDPIVQPNILLIIADDMGLDATPNYTEGSTKPNMPNLESLMQTGLRFENVWASSVCTPTRSTIITGKYGVNTDVYEPGDVLNTSHQTIQELLDTETSNAYSHAIIGKWHLAGSGSGTATHPTESGVGHYAGLISGSTQDYSNWSFTENGTTTTSTDYITTKFSDLAIDWIGQQTQPWFCWLAYTAPHTPLHLPDTELHSQGSLPTDATSISNNPTPYFMAMMEAMDHEMGRVIDAIPSDERDNTIIIFIGDNGTARSVIQSPYLGRQSKSSLYQGGINVPMVVSGYGVNRTGTESALIHSADLYATIAELANTGISSVHNSVSFKSLLSNSGNSIRDYVYTDEADGWAIRNSQYKLIEYNDGTQEMYDLVNDTYERTNLLDNTLSTEAATAKTALENEASSIRN